MRTFTIHITKRADHILVNICKDKREFSKAILDCGETRKDVYGLCAGAKIEDYQHKGKAGKCDAAVIWLIENQVGAGYVTHELTHAVMYLLRHQLKRLLLSPQYWKSFHACKIEEYICETMGHVNRKFWMWWNRNCNSKGRLK